MPKRKLTLNESHVTVMMKYLQMTFLYINFLCLDVFLNAKISLEIKMTLQTTSNSNLKSFGSRRRKEN